MRGGGAPVRIYLPELLQDVLAERINPGQVLDYETDLDEIGDASAAMDERWAVRAGHDLFVRAAYGPDTGWHRVARTSRQARIWAGGVETDVGLEDVAGDALDLVDEAYREKYGRHSSIVDGITNDQARSTTLRLVPRAAL